MHIAADRDLVVIEVTGPDRIEYLDNVTTQRLQDVAPGVVTGLLVLDGKGVPQAIAWALVGQDAITLLAPPSSADHLMDVVATRTFLAQVSFARLDVPVTSIAAAGEGTLADELAAAGLAVDADSWTTHDGLVVARHAFGVELVGATTDDVVELVDVEVVTADALAIQSGEPRWGHEVVAGRLPEEYGLLATHVHLAKGCYPGQEPIAHMWMLGRPRRRLALIELDGDAAGGDGGDAVSGRDGDRGFAFVAPDTEPGAEVAAGVRVNDFVGADRDVVGWTPAQTRRRDRGGSVDLPRRAP